MTSAVNREHRSFITDDWYCSALEWKAKTKIDMGYLLGSGASRS